jgi:hypothetical protein
VGLSVVNWICLIFGHQWNVPRTSLPRPRGCSCIRPGCTALRQVDQDGCLVTHDWGLFDCVCPACGEERHKWDGCVCKKCGARQPGHTWNDECNCPQCGFSAPVWASIHEWNGCACRRCDSKRDAEHIWDEKCRCLRCNKLAPDSDPVHLWNGCVCGNCGTLRDAGHNWDERCRCSQCRVLAPESDSVHEWQEYDSETEYTKHPISKTHDHTWSTRTYYSCAKCGRLKEECSSGDCVVY